MNFSVHPSGRNSHHIKPPDNAGNTTGVKGTPDLDQGEREEGEVEVRNQAEQPGERAGGGLAFALLPCSGFYQMHIHSAGLSAGLSLAALRVSLKSTQCILQLLPRRSQGDLGEPQGSRAGARS